VRDRVVEFLWDCKKRGKVVVAYGAAAKGNTLLNFAGVRKFLLPQVFDAAPSKQHKFLPGTRIPIELPSVLKGLYVDYVVVLPWNIRREVEETLRALPIEKSAKIVTFIPTLEIF
jgi:hypothetical protein